MNLIVAHDELGGIGKNNAIPWKCSEDLRNFRSLTTGSGNNSVIMGRLTWESLRNRELPNRRNIILSTSLNTRPSGNVLVASSIAEACELAKDSEETWVIGGSQVYNSFLERNLIKKMWITQIPGKFDCDTFFSVPRDWEAAGHLELTSSIWVRLYEPKNNKDCQ